MPHDVRGNELKPGDEVVLRARVRDIYHFTTGCNAYFDVIDVGGTAEYLPTIACNTRLAEKQETPTCEK